MDPLDAVSQREMANGLSVSAIESVVREIIGDDAIAIARQAHIAILLRMLETSLISNPRMMSMIRTPNIYLGREEQELRGLFGSLGISTPSGDLIKFFVDIIRGRVAQTINKTRVDAKLFASVLRENYQSEEEFRCKDCGYHFLRTDLSKVKGEDAYDFGVRFGTETPTQRFRDPWKPSKDYYRHPTVDHIQPEAALGTSMPENLRIVCGFCNSRKKINRWPIEGFGPRVTSSLMAIVGGERGQWAIESAVYFSICQSGVCSACGESARTAELTAVPEVGDYKWTGLLPWQLRVVCYKDSGLQ